MAVDAYYKGKKMTSYIKKIDLTEKSSQLFSILDIELTERCNNHCIHCYIDQPENDLKTQEQEMKTPFLKQIIREAAELGVTTIRFTGGEPLLREDFEELYLYTKKLGLIVLLYTNARLITPELAELFNILPPGDTIQVTTYGMNPGSYETATKAKGSFSEYYDGIMRLESLKIPYILKMALFPSNVHEREEYERFIKGRTENKRPLYIKMFEMRTRHDNDAKNQRIQQLRYSPEQIIGFLDCEKENYLERMEQFLSKFAGPHGSKLFRCGAGKHVCIDAYGNAQMCSSLRHPDTIYPLNGSQHANSHSWNNLSTLEYVYKVFFPKVRQREATNQEYHNKCAVCFLSDLCDHCPAKSWSEHGTLDTPVEYYCEITHGQAYFLGLLKSKEKTWELEPKVWKSRINAFLNRKH